MDFKKRVNGSWTDTPNYIHNTFTDTITTLPTDIYTNDTTATVGLKGNMEQSSTPTPDNPIQPQETGERTGNLWNAEGFSARAITFTHEHSNTNSYGTTLSSTTGKEVSITQANYPTGDVNYKNGFFMIDVDFSKYAVGDVVTISFDYIVNEIHSLSTQKTTQVYAGKDSNAVPFTLSSGDWKNSGKLTAVITIIANMNPYVEVRLCGNSITVKNVMLNSGSTALPYEPYGYKLTISSANTTTPIYLGEVETTRQIKKLVLTGKETFYRDKEREGSWRFYSDRLVSANYNLSICSHFVNIGTSGVNDTDNIGFSLFNSSQFGCRCPKSVANTVNEFKAWLANQYAAGTPITVWYILAEPTTGIVNEPLRKIGDYDDTVRGITIPTIAGTNTIDVETTLKPSEVSVNYKGWHPVSALHKFNGTSWN